MNSYSARRADDGFLSLLIAPCRCVAGSDEFRVTLGAGPAAHSAVVRHLSVRWRLSRSTWNV
jgi:hypothetical protein